MGGGAALMITVASAAWADVPSVLQARDGGAPPGYNEPSYFDPDYKGDQGLVSYNDPFKGQSDAALKAKIAPLQKTTLNNIFNLSGIGGQSDGVPVRGTKSTQWKGVIAQRDTFGGPAKDALTGRTNFGSEEFIGDAFYSTIDKKRWDQFVEETSARRERLEGSIRDGVRDVRGSLESTLSGTNPRFDREAYEQLDRDLMLLESDMRRERNILQEEIKRANDRFLGLALRYEQQMNDEEKAFWQTAIIVTVTAGVGVTGLAAGGMTGPAMVMTETSSGVAFTSAYSIADLAAAGVFAGFQGAGLTTALIATMERMVGRSPAGRSALEKMKMAQAPINAVKGAYDASVEDINRLQNLRSNLGQARQINQSLYHRQTGQGLRCNV
ncbi:MAG: hypothetical protein ACK4QW_12225 [Alphaproteobacteria bacterium]